MNQPYPEFKSGNAALVDALNQVVEYARRHGVNPGGRHGWNETPDGWMPPLFRGGEGGIDTPWTLEAGENPGEWKVTLGTILQGDDSVSGVLTCSNPSHSLTLVDGSIVAIKIESEDPTDYSIVELPSWPESGGAAVTFTGTVADGDFVMESRHYPLWQVTSTLPTAPHRSIGDSLFAVRIAPLENLAIVKRLYRTPAGELVTLPSFAVSHRAIEL